MTSQVGGRNAAVVGDPRANRADRHEIRLRHRPMRRLLGAHQRRGDTVLLDAGRRRRATDKITTIEGLSPTASHPVQKAWLAIDVPQCGYCQSGQIMAAAALLAKKPKPTDEDIDAAMTAISAAAAPISASARPCIWRPADKCHPPGQVWGVATMTRQEDLSNAAAQGFAPQIRRRHRRRRRRPRARLPRPFDIDTAARRESGAEVNAWVVVKPDDTCVIRIARAEMGQGTLTGLAQLVAEELECDWNKVATESGHAGTEPRPQAHLG